MGVDSVLEGDSADARKILENPTESWQPSVRIIIPFVVFQKMVSKHQTFSKVVFYKSNVDAQEGNLLVRQKPDSHVVYRSLVPEN